MGEIIEFPHPMLTGRLIQQWRLSFPDAPENDPRVGGDGVCRKCGETFAWYGYEGLCGWCHDEN